jgi:glycosyltransferase involved in cell wall biosynthesis
LSGDAPRRLEGLPSISRSFFHSHVPKPLLLVSPMLPPMRGGLPDHTFRLAQELSAQFDVTVISSRGVETHAPFRVSATVENWRSRREIESALDAVPAQAPIVWQYVPHMYGRGGVNRELPRVMRRLKTRGRKQIVIAHEIAAGLSWRPNWLWFALHHRWQWRQIVRIADVVPISTERWVEEWSTRWPAFASKFFVLPSPSSIPRIDFSPNDRVVWRQEHELPANAVLMAYFGTVSAAKQFPWVIDAWKAAQNTARPIGLVIIGGSPQIPFPGQIGNLYRPLGFLPANDVSKALSACDLLVLPFIDGVSERRTTFMAGLDHSLAISTTRGHNTGRTLRNAGFLAITDASDSSRFVRETAQALQDQERLLKLSSEGKLFHDNHFQWKTVVKSLIDRMTDI